MPRTRTLLAGAALAIGARSLMNTLLLEKFRADVRALNGGDYSGLLASYADDAVLAFNDGPHRWAGEHRGKDAIEVFLRDFTGAGLQGEVLEVWTSGPPWALSMVARFDDHATGPDGERIYENEVVVIVRTRMGKIVRHEDYYSDTSRIAAFEKKLTEMGIKPAG
ncbi:MAG TPA: nuclear transport factor 2 family protein [Solirubrobacterales bacterium]|nr:nuclear transport factor 2 family protein [Solirubrobacterales bacterium]